MNITFGGWLSTLSVTNSDLPKNKKAKKSKWNPTLMISESRAIFFMLR
jgi:hypothetical protein